MISVPREIGADVYPVKTISNFREIRSDGLALDEHTTLDGLAIEGRKPDKIVRLEWQCDADGVVLEHPSGMLAQLLPSKTGLALMLFEGKEPFARNLQILDADGRQRLVIEGLFTYGGRRMSGKFAWFEPARKHGSECIGTVLLALEDDQYYQLDIDVLSGKIAAVYPVQ